MIIENSANNGNIQVYQENDGKNKIDEEIKVNITVGGGEEKKTCPICYCDIKNLAYFECKHYVCIECFLKVVDKNTCSICRKKFNFSDINNTPYDSNYQNYDDDMNLSEHSEEVVDDVIDILVLQDRRKIIIEGTYNNEIYTNIFNVCNRTNKRLTRYFVNQLSQVFENFNEKRIIFNLFAIGNFVYSISYANYHYDIEVGGHSKKIIITEIEPSGNA